MPYVVRKDGSIVCDTPAEAVLISKALSGENTRPTRQVKQIKSESADKLINSLRGLEGSTIDSGQMAEILNTTITGVGTKLRHIGNAMATEGKNIDEYLEPRRDAAGHTTWKILEKEPNL